MRAKIFLCFLLLVSCFLQIECGDKKHSFNDFRTELITSARPDLTYIRDEKGRYLYFHGVNLSCSSKFPAKQNPPSYVGKPFPIEKADDYFKIIKGLGFNIIRLIVIWEGIEPEKKGKYDTEYLDYIEKIVKKAKDYGLYVLIDMHQDIFSRHLTVKYNDKPKYGNPGSIESIITSLVPPYTDEIRGDGAPRWAVKACLPEKNMDSPNWGIFRILGSLDLEDMAKIAEIYKKLTKDEESELPEFISYFLSNLPEPFPVNESTDLMPFTIWGINGGISVDIERCFASFFAGDKIYPKYKIEGKSIKDYLQEAYINAYLQVVQRVGDEVNVVGYDLMNEPISAFIMLTLTALYFQTGSTDGMEKILTTFLGEDFGRKVYEIIIGLNLLPPDTSDETKKLWGFDGADLMAILDLSWGFDKKYLQPFYEKLGKKIQEKDPDANIWIEQSLGLNPNAGLGGLPVVWEINMTKPEGVKNVIYAPHWYPDIYPFLGFNQPPREFTEEEWEFRDFTAELKSAISKSSYSLGNIPAVIGEFGTYFNFNGIEKSKENNYIVSSQILDNYFENFEALFQSHILWCFSPENTYEDGDGWNKEDFSILDPQKKTRSERTYSRPYPRAMSGKPVSMHFYSDFHYFDPEKGIVNPEREFELKFESKETPAPAEIFVPAIQYPDGFYTWISDGYCIYDYENQILYYYPVEDKPGWIHSLKIRPPLKGQENIGWNYFFKGDMVINGE